MTKGLNGNKNYDLLEMCGNEIRPAVNNGADTSVLQRHGVTCRRNILEAVTRKLGQIKGLKLNDNVSS